MDININDIKILKRVRKDLGDIESLKESIKEFGLFSPILITPKNELISGYRRLISHIQLGYETIKAKYIMEYEYENLNNLKNIISNDINIKDEFKSLYDNIGINNEELKKLNISMCYTCKCMCRGISFHKHHFLHKSENGNNSNYNKVTLCPNCHALYHYFDRNILSSLFVFNSDVNFISDYNEIKSYLYDNIKEVIINSTFEQHSYSFGDISKEERNKSKDGFINLMNDLLLCKLLYLVNTEILSNSAIQQIRSDYEN